MFQSPSGFWSLPCQGASSSSGTLLISSKLRCSSPSLTVSGSGSKSHDLASLHHVSHLASCGALALFANLSFSRSMSMLSRSLLCAMLAACCSLDLLAGMFSLIVGKDGRFTGPVMQELADDDCGLWSVCCIECHRNIDARTCIGMSSSARALDRCPICRSGRCYCHPPSLLQRVGRARTGVSCPGARS